MILRVLVAIALGGLLLFLGVGMLRAVAGRRPEERPAEPEDVAHYEVYFVCNECGTEMQVTRLGSLQIPRHCGEKMEPVRRALPGGDPTLN